MEGFFKVLENFFLNIHDKYYKQHEIDHEHNFVFWFFFDVLNGLIANNSDLRIFIRWKLTNLEDDLRSGGEPDIIIYTRQMKIALIIEFQKMTNLYY